MWAPAGDRQMLRASAPPSPEHMETQDQTCRIQTMASVRLHTLHRRNEAFHLSCKVKLTEGVSRQPAAAVLPTEGAHTQTHYEK